MVTRNHAPSIEDYLLKRPYPLREIGGRRRTNATTNIEFPLVTILTVVLNRKATLPRTIMSVANQIYKNIEYIIIDGASTDGTLEVIKAYDDYINLWISEPDKNVADAVNKAISLSKGEFICWIPSDDWIDTDFIEKAVTIFNKNRNYEYIYGNIRVFTNNTYVKTFYGRQFSGSAFESKDCQTPSFQSMMLKRDCFVNAGLLNYHYLIACDLEFYERLVYKNYTGLFNGDLIVNCSTGGMTEIHYLRKIFELLHIANKYGYLSITIIATRIYPVIHFIASKVAARILPVSIFRFLRKIVKNPY